MPLEDARALFEEGGFEHCQGDNITLGITLIADWLSDKLDARRRA